MSYTPQTPLVEQRHAGGFIVSIGNGHQSIDRIEMTQGFGRLQPGTVVAFNAATFTATGTATAENTGDGTLTGAVATYPALAGSYKVTLISDTEFTVTNPNGEPVGALGGTIDLDDAGVVDAPGTVGVVFNAQGIGFLIVAGETAFIAGDSFTLVVTDTGGGWAPFRSASSGVTAYGLLHNLTDTTNAGVMAAAVVRQAEVNASELIWDASLSATQQNTAIAALKAQGVISR